MLAAFTVQVQDSTPRTQFVLTVTNGGTFGLDGQNIGVGFNLGPNTKLNPATAVPIFTPLHLVATIGGLLWLGRRRKALKVTNVK